MHILCHILFSVGGHCLEGSSFGSDFVSLGDFEVISRSAHYDVFRILKFYPLQNHPIRALVSFFRALTSSKKNVHAQKKKCDTKCSYKIHTKTALSVFMYMGTDISLKVLGFESFANINRNHNRNLISIENLATSHCHPHEHQARINSREFVALNFSQPR